MGERSTRKRRPREWSSRRNMSSGRVSRRPCCCMRSRVVSSAGSGISMVHPAASTRGETEETGAEGATSQVVPRHLGIRRFSNAPTQRPRLEMTSFFRRDSRLARSNLRSLFVALNEPKRSGSKLMRYQDGFGIAAQQGTYVRRRLSLKLPFFCWVNGVLIAMGLRSPPFCTIRFSRSMGTACGSPVAR
jgi:hypothetical protein